MTESLFGNAIPSTADAADGTTNYVLGTRFTPAVAGVIPAGRWRFPNTIPSPTVPVQIGVYRVGDQALLGSASFPLAATLGAWNEVNFPAPIPVSAGVQYAVAVWTPLRYVATPNYPWPATSANLTAPAANGWLTANPGALAFPVTQSGNAATYFADVVFTPTAAGPVDGAAAFSATGTLTGGGRVVMGGAGLLSAVATLTGVGRLALRGAAALTANASARLAVGYSPTVRRSAAGAVRRTTAATSRRGAS